MFSSDSEGRAQKQGCTPNLGWGPDAFPLRRSLEDPLHHLPTFACGRAPVRPWLILLGATMSIGGSKTRYKAKARCTAHPRRALHSCRFQGRRSSCRRPSKGAPPRHLPTNDHPCASAQNNTTSVITCFTFWVASSIDSGTISLTRQRKHGRMKSNITEDTTPNPIAPQRNG